MHKFIIVGHPQSGYQEVENLLHECGMGKAKPSRREGLLPDQISETLRQAHGTPALAAITAQEEIEQIGTAPVWHGMAMDLMLGNLDQRFWGWADPGAIHLLEYWKQLDPTINFVFVYADPQSALVGPDADDALSVEAKLSNWQAFNAAMLHFYNRNPKRSVLVQAEQVRHSVRTYLQQLRTQLNAPLSEPPAHLLPAFEGNQAARDTQAVAEADVPEADANGADTLPVVTRAHALPAEEFGVAEVMDEASLPRFVAAHCVAQHPAAGQLYEELQAVANLPLDLAMQSRPTADAAWVALLTNARRTERLGASTAEQTELKEENELLLNQLHQVQEELERLFHARTDNEKALALAKSSEGALRERLDALQAEEARLKDALGKKTAEHDETLEENELLLTQLHAVQEELERIFLEKERLNKALKAAKDQDRAALDKLKAALDKKTSEQQKTQNENRRLLSQLQVVQEELERRHAEIQHLKKTMVPRDPPLYGAAERVKQQLTYRLGATMIEKSKSVGGWLSMPFALIGTASRFRAEQRARGGKKHPPLFKYKDADQAERVKQHLSYRVGTVLLRNVKSPIGWARLPFALRREIKAFRLERQKARAND